MTDRGPIREFMQLAQREEEEINLAEAALVIARTEYPELDTPSQLARLDLMAQGIDAHPDDPPLNNIEALNGFLFDREQFIGNEEAYDDPRNSFLNEVLDRKLGIPITLSLLYMEIAGRLGLPVVGVGFPGHFVVKYMTGASEVIIDPYYRGKILTEEDCAERLRSHFGEQAELKPEYLLASTPKQILARMLNNLKGSYFRRRNFNKVLTMIELSLAIDPNSRENTRDRGMVYFAMNRPREALADLKNYVQRSRPADPEVREVLQVLHRIRGMLN